MCWSRVCTRSRSKSREGAGAGAKAGAGVEAGEGEGAEAARGAGVGVGADVGEGAGAAIILLCQTGSPLRTLAAVASLLPWKTGHLCSLRPDLPLHCRNVPHRGQ